MGEIFIGSEAVANGVVTRHELQRWYRPLYPNVHVVRGGDPSYRDKVIGAWLWSKRNGIVTGTAASALHGAEWVDDDVPIELLWNCTRPPRGIVVRNERISDDEVIQLAGLPVTTPARTAFDLGRYLERGQALARVWCPPKPDQNSESLRFAKAAPPILFGLALHRRTGMVLHIEPSDDRPDR